MCSYRYPQRERLVRKKSNVDRIRSPAPLLSGLSVKGPNTFSLTVLEQYQDKLCNLTQSIIRLQGIDAPERTQAFCTKSKEHLSDLIAGQIVTVEYHDLDRYQRILGKVLIDGEDINLEQVSSGIAWHYKKYNRELTTADRILYSDAEREAQRQKLGLWHDPHPISLWD